MMKLFIILGALCTMMSVGTGAFGAHGLEGKLSDKYMSVWEKAVNYQMYHGLGLIIIGVISGTTSINVNWAGWLLFLGVVFFEWFVIYISFNTNPYLRSDYTNWWCIIYRGLVNAYYLYI